MVNENKRNEYSAEKRKKEEKLRLKAEKEARKVKIAVFFNIIKQNQQKKQIHFFYVRIVIACLYIICLHTVIPGEQSISLRLFFYCFWFLLWWFCWYTDAYLLFCSEFYFQEEKRQAKEEKKRGKNVKYFSLLCDNKTDSKSKK